MSEELKPCQCGYSGALMGMACGGYYHLQCPECNASVQAFTIQGLGDAWNKTQGQAPDQQERNQ